MTNRIPCYRCSFESHTFWVDRNGTMSPACAAHDSFPPSTFIADRRVYRSDVADREYEASLLRLAAREVLDE